MKYARALVRMPAEFDGDHGIARAASNHARRTAGAGQAGNIQNLSMPTTMRSALSASPSSKAHIRAALMLGRSLPMGLVPAVRPHLPASPFVGTENLAQICRCGNAFCLSRASISNLI